jgi:hypothetical protein
LKSLWLPVRGLPGYYLVNSKAGRLTLSFIMKVLRSDRSISRHLKKGYAYVRFTKLQDVLGAKVFPRILTRLGEDVRSMAFIDVLSRLEALGFIDSADTWLSLREQRNRLSHDYPDDPDILAAELNSALGASEVLLEYWQNLQERIGNNQHLES